MLANAFLAIFLRKISKCFFLKIFDKLFFVQTRKNLTNGLLNLLKNMLKYCIFSNFLKRNFEKFRKFSQTSPTNCVFGQTAQKFNAWIANFFEKYAKIMHF